MTDHEYIYTAVDPVVITTIRDRRRHDVARHWLTQIREELDAKTKTKESR